MVKLWHTRHRSEVREGSALWQQAERRACYLSKMKGLCFNCLVRNHQVAACWDPTRCWRCHRSCHISTCAPRGHNIASTCATIILSPYLAAPPITAIQIPDSYRHTTLVAPPPLSTTTFFTSGSTRRSEFERGCQTRCCLRPSS
jgi:hypothetical protein